MDWQTWLPDDALMDGVLETEFLRKSLDWARIWFAPETSLQVGVRLGIPNRSPDKHPEFCWRTQRDEATVRLSGGGEEVIARAMLGIAMGKGRPNAADRRLFSRMAREGIRDFCSRLELLLPADTRFTEAGEVPVPGDRQFEVSVSIGESDNVFRVRCAPGLAASVRKKLVSARPVDRPRGSFKKAIGSQLVRVGARLGSSSLRLAELDNLAPGDILLLDRAIDQPVELTVENVPAGTYRAFLEPVDGGITLRFRDTPHV